MESISSQLEEMERIDIEKLREKDVFKSKKLFNCILGLNDLETQVFAYLLNNSDVGTSELTDFFDMDRSSIQRALQALYDMNLISRESMSLKKYSNLKNLKHLKKRGYLYVYNANDIKEIKKRMKFLLKKWYESMDRYIDSIDSLFDCYEENGELCSEFEFK
ncbi:MAG: putative transcriptional regulator [Promethearchaeota archaeon]|jgi:predicted transcriptional regulator|nr:MAG: putative transcriptional regulator [Candidatus Lokiarchaeota archaeon]